MNVHDNMEYQDENGKKKLIIGIFSARVSLYRGELM